MTHLIHIAGVCERDIDLFLVEELAAHAEFRAWLADAAGLGALEREADVHVAKSVTHSTGESDVELTATLLGGRICKLLIENKVDAALQLDQAKRYRDRAAAYVTSGACAIARTLIVAPSRYFGSKDDSLGFDADISYEEILEWLSRTFEDTDRLLFKQELIRTAISKAVTGYHGVADRAMTDIWDRYGRLVEAHAPELNMPAAKRRPSGSTFVFFKPDTLPKGTLLVHKFAYGHVDIEFSGWGSRVGELRSILQPLPDGTTVVIASKSAALRRVVPKLSVSAPIEEQEARIVEGVTAAKTLWRWLKARSDVHDIIRENSA